MYSLFIYGNKKAPAGDPEPYSVLQLPSVRDSYSSAPVLSV